MYQSMACWYSCRACGWKVTLTILWVAGSELGLRLSPNFVPCNGHYLAIIDLGSATVKLGGPIGM